MFALILTVCVAMSSGDDACEENDVDAFPTIEDCMIALDAHPQRRDDRYLSCGWRDGGDLLRPTGESLDSVLARLNADEVKP